MCVDKWWCVLVRFTSMTLSDRFNKSKICIKKKEKAVTSLSWFSEWCCVSGNYAFSLFAKYQYNKKTQLFKVSRVVLLLFLFLMISGTIN